MSVRLGGAAEGLGHACGSLGLRVRKISVTGGLEMGTGDDFRRWGRARACGPAAGFGLERAAGGQWHPEQCVGAAGTGRLGEMASDGGFQEDVLEEKASEQNFVALV